MAAVTKVSQTRLFTTAEIYCLAFLEAGRNPGVSRACSLKAMGGSILCLSSWLLVFSASLACLGWWILLSRLGFHHHVAIVFPLCARGCLLTKTPVVWDRNPSYPRMTLSPIFTSATTPFPNKITFQDYGKDHSFGRTLFNPIHGTRSRLPWWLRQ